MVAKGREMVTNLLWTDDDCNEFLDPLSRKLRKHGFILTKATNYTDAIAALVAEDIQSLLVDIILPHASGTGALASDLGLVLADRSVGYGIKAITFLTVVRMDEVLEDYKSLKKKHPEVRFSFFDKTLLLEPNSIEKIVQSLKPTD